MTDTRTVRETIALTLELSSTIGLLPMQVCAALDLDPDGLVANLHQLRDGDYIAHDHTVVTRDGPIVWRPNFVRSASVPEVRSDKSTGGET